MGTLLFPDVPGGPELIVMVLMAVLSVAFYLALAVVAVRIALLFIEYPESQETRNRVALLEHEVADLQARVDELESK
ncbi:MAG: hypothetical protein ABEI77_10820 [Halorientalis sp.]